MPRIRLVDSAEQTVDATRRLLRASEVHPVVDGLHPEEVVVIRAREAASESWGRFMSDDAGVLDLSRSSPSEGTWRGADGTAWIWSMQPVARPTADTSVTLVLERSGRPAVTFSLLRGDVPDGVETIAVTEPDVVGRLVVPPGPGPFPAIIVLGGSEGGNGTSYRRSLDVCRAEFVCLALSYFGGPGQEPSILEIPVERIENAINWLRKHPKVDATRLGILGDSRGGELALIAGSLLRSIQAVAAVVPSGLVWGAMRNPNEPAWTYRGKALAFVPWDGTRPELSRDAAGTATVRTLPLFASSLAAASPAQRAAATIQVESIEGSVLLIGGKDDQLWPSCALASVAFERLEKAGHVKRFGDRFVCFESAGHRIGVPGGSTLEHARDLGDIISIKGGTAQGAARAEYEARRLLHEHFQRALGVKNARGR